MLQSKGKVISITLESILFLAKILPSVKPTELLEISFSASRKSTSSSRHWEPSLAEVGFRNCLICLCTMRISMVG